MYLNTIIRSRSEEIFNGKNSTVTSVNDLGEFDILYSHANFISIIKKYIIIDKGLQTERRIEVPTTGVLRVLRDYVEVFI